MDAAMEEASGAREEHGREGDGREGNFKGGTLRRWQLWTGCIGHGLGA